MAVNIFSFIHVIITTTIIRVGRVNKYVGSIMKCHSHANPLHVNVAFLFVESAVLSQQHLAEI